LPVPLKIAYPLTCRVLGPAVVVFDGDPAKDAELRTSAYQTVACG
jgi:hypothetical protein